MGPHTRRTVLKVGGAVLGGIATGTTVAAAESADRYILDTRGVDELGDLTVIHDLSPVDLAVVRGSESAVEAVGTDYAVDLEYSLQPPSDGRLYREYGAADSNGQGQSADATDEPFFDLYQWDKQALDVPAAHEVTRGEGTRVAIIDSGVASGHPDLAHAVNVDLSRNFTGDGYPAAEPIGGFHGTHVAGIVAANDRNEEGVVGTAPATEIVDCRVFSRGPFAEFGDILAAMVYAGSIEADAANLSLGAYPVPRQGLGGFYGRSLNRVMTFVNAQGTALCIAAGNDGADLQHDGDFISLPNEGAQAISVSATGPIGYRWGDPGLRAPFESPAFYTNFGTNAIDLGAPGGDADLDAIGTDADWFLDLVFNTIAEPNFTGSGTYRGADYGYGWVAGTSMAAPQVSGAVALVRSQHPDWQTDQVESALERAASVPEGYDKPFYGSGFLNLVDAV
jgi:subtilisin family serine protease